MTHTVGLPEQWYRLHVAPDDHRLLASPWRSAPGKLSREPQTASDRLKRGRGPLNRAIERRGCRARGIALVAAACLPVGHGSPSAATVNASCREPSIPSSSPSISQWVESYELTSPIFA